MRRHLRGRALQRDVPRALRGRRGAGELRRRQHFGPPKGGRRGAAALLPGLPASKREQQKK